MSSSIPLLINGPSSGTATLVLAHGAGAPMDCEFMEYIATQLASENVKVVRFEFPYMSERRNGGSKRPPNRTPQLLSCWHAVLEQLRSEKNLFIDGLSAFDLFRMAFENIITIYSLRYKYREKYRGFDCYIFLCIAQS